MTDRALGDAELHRLADAAEHGLAGIISMDRDGRVRHWSEGAERVFGYRAEEVVGVPAAELNRRMGHSEGVNERAGALFEAMLAGADPVRISSHSRRRDGTDIETINTFLPWRDGERIVGMTIVALDVTGRSEAHAAAAQLAAVAEASDDAIVGFSVDGRVTSWNRGAASTFGYERREIVGRHVSELVPGGSEGEVAITSSVVAGHPVRRLETVVRRRDGEPLEVSLSAFPLRDHDGTVTGVGAVFRDMRDRRRADRTNRLLAAVVESVDEAIISAAPDGTITTWNPAAERIFGYSAAEIVGADATVLAPEDRRHEIADALKMMSCGEVRRGETVRRRKDGTLVEIASTISPLLDDQGSLTGLTSVIRDISAQRRIEREREATLRELNEAQRLARMGSFIWDATAGTVLWSDSLFAMLRRDPELGPSPEWFLGVVHPDDRDRITNLYATGFGGEREWEVDFRMRFDDGDVRVIRGRGRLDAARSDVYHGTFQDVTAEHERAELIQASIRADAANRAKSDFLARMSHELRTPLNAIIGFTELLALEGLDDEQQEDLGHVLKAGRHLLALVDDVLDIARIDASRLSTSPEPISVADAVRDVIVLIGGQAAESDVTLEQAPDAADGCGLVMADPVRLRQVLLNLLSNAIKYNRPGGRVTVSSVRDPSDRVRIAVTDTGIGIEPAHLSNLFVPFERLGAERTDVEGTGLGLALSKGLIEAMGGTVDVQTRPGEGSTFLIELAAASATAPAGDAAPAPASLPPEVGGRRPRILYIEDNLSNLALVERIIERAGEADLIPAMQGRLGIELARDHPPDLVLLDLHLPDMRGVDVLKRLRADHRDLSVIVITADVSPTRGDEVRRLGAVAHLTKPIEVTRLLAVISEQLRRLATS